VAFPTTLEKHRPYSPETSLQEEHLPERKMWKAGENSTSQLLRSFREVAFPTFVGFDARHSSVVQAHSPDALSVKSGGHRF
jgi:hypothetical protein